MLTPLPLPSLLFPCCFSLSTSLLPFKAQFCLNPALTPFHEVVHSFNKYLLIPCYVPATLLAVGNMMKK